LNARVENTEVEQDEPELNPLVERTEEERQAEADMMAGFTGKAPEKKDDKDTEPAAPTGEQKKEETEDKTPVSEPQKDPLATAMDTIASLQKQYRDLAGNVGGMAQIVKTLQETAKAASKAGQEAPTEKQLSAAVTAAAAGSSAKLKQLMEDFPDVADALNEALAIERAEITKQIPKVDADAIAEKAAQRAASHAETTAEAAVAKARALARIDLAHDGWEETVATPEFKQWLVAQPAETQRLADSDAPKDSIKLLDSYKAHREAAAAEAEKQKSKTRRLESAVPVKGTGGTPGPQVLDGEDAFVAGFNGAR